MTDKGDTQANRKPLKHTVNGDEANGWYCYQCSFFSRDVAKAAEHDGWVEVGETVTPPQTREDKFELDTPTLGVIAENAMFWRNEEITKLRDRLVAADALADKYEIAARIIHAGQYHSWRYFADCTEKNCVEARAALEAYRKQRQ